MNKTSPRASTAPLIEATARSLSKARLLRLKISEALLAQVAQPDHNQAQQHQSNDDVFSATHPDSRPH